MKSNSPMGKNISESRLIEQKKWMIIFGEYKMLIVLTSGCIFYRSNTLTCKPLVLICDFTSVRSRSQNIIMFINVPFVFDLK